MLIHFFQAEGIMAATIATRERKAFKHPKTGSATVYEVELIPPLRAWTGTITFFLNSSGPSPRASPRKQAWARGYGCRTRRVAMTESRLEGREVPVCRKNTHAKKIFSWIGAIFLSYCVGYCIGSSGHVVRRGWALRGQRDKGATQSP